MRPASIDTPAVLFVDDDERLLESLRIVLRREPYTILTALSVEGARQVIARNRVDVVVCDERLPTQNGTAFLAELKNAAYPAVRIVLSGGGVPTAQRAINDAAVFRFLAKPCTSKAIAEAVRDAIAHVFERSADSTGCYRIIPLREAGQ